MSGLFHAPLRLLAILLAALSPAGNAADPITARTDPVGKLLNEWAAAGTAAGLSHLTYENRDDAHSMLPVHLWPDLKVHAFSEEDRAKGRNKGPAHFIRDIPTLGNGSMAASADKGGSLPRIYFMDPAGSTFLAKQYLSNQLFIYPEHQDHDPGGNGIVGWGDLFPLNTPTVLISQGSSGSDQPFLQALLSTTAAFPPSIQRTLIDRRLLAPTLQQLLRRNSRLVKTDADYLTGAAHPVVFDAADIDERQMVLAANRMTRGSIPPIALIAIQDETDFQPSSHFFEPDNPHPWKLATTPVSIARLFRGNLSHYECTITTQASGDLLGRPLTLKPVVLQGDPDLVEIRPNAEGRSFHLRLRWQPPETTTRPDQPIRSHRVDIGFFADNGVTVSAPAIFSLFMLPNERRFYDAKGRLTEISYLASNPDLGLPIEDTDPRWMEAFKAATLPTDSLPGTLMERALEAPEGAWFRVSHSRLSVMQERLTQLEKDQNSGPNPNQATAATERQTLSNTLKDLLATTLPGTRQLTARQTLVTAFQSISRYTDLYPAFHRELDALAAQSPHPESPAALKAEAQKLIDWGFLIHHADNRITARSALDQRPAAESYHLQALNLTALSHALFPRALKRQPGPAWTDPRLTTRKAWRDVFHYDETTGDRLGWTRHLTGRTFHFDANGHRLPNKSDPEKTPIPVMYLPDPDTGLRFEPLK